MIDLIVGTLLGIASLLGLFMASRAVDGAMYSFGLMIFAFATLFIFYLIHKAVER